MFLKNPFAVLLFFLPILLHGQEEKKKLKDWIESSLVVEMDIAKEFKSKDFQKTELLLQPEFTFKKSKNSKFVFKGQIYMDFNDKLEAGEPKEATVSDFSQRLFIGDRLNFELREFYWYTNIHKKLRLTTGKQQIVWGETDGLKLLDIVNPQNFREFVLDDFENSRIPLWSVKAEFDVKDIGVQWIWIPDNTYHITQDFDAPFFTKNLIQMPPEGVPFMMEKVNKPNRFIADSDIGIKLNTFVKGWDLSLNYLYYYDDLPVLYTALNMDDIGNPSIAVVPKFEREHLLGGNFNKVFGSAIFRGEIAYIFNHNFSSIDQGTVNGIESSGQYKSAIALDYIKGEYFLSFQLFSDLIISDISAYNRDKFETNTSFKFSKEMMNDNLTAEMLWVHNANHGDGYIRPQLSYWLSSNSQLFLGSTIFYGNENYLFGQFQDRSRVSLGMKWGI